ncbi:amino acid transporter [Algimonas ampicilliniresistens]|uniref:Amino acid transporter n=1 Tax=Algimonas ampicilliniresistens TaxID=1298735 RepID=A0ABQ5VB63_9PROT|nr:LysE family translocator [Algimonas ampicilliniresistens]GLQ24053.1 amino acid transporter [Algimonas ampicilliniresistens]
MEFDVWLSLVVLFTVGGLTPGPAVMLVMASSFRYGFRPAMLPALGIASANVLWLILAASGTAALLTAFPSVTLGLKVLGLLVILYLGLSTIFGPPPDMSVSSGDAPKRTGLYARGVALQISSPLPLVYFGMLLPLYFDADKPILPQFGIMLATVTWLELQGLAVYAAFARWIRAKLQSPKAAKIFNAMIGVVMIASGVWAIFA